MPTARDGFQGGAPPERVRTASDRRVRESADFVLYWMTTARRATSNFALDRAAAWCRELGRPLVVLEALRVDYPFASDRLHRFAMDGMADNARSFDGSAVQYYPYIERERGAGAGLLEALAADAAVVVTDEYPCSPVAQAVSAAVERVPVRLEAVDSNGLIPLASIPRAFPAAVHQRRFMQRALREHLAGVPVRQPQWTDLPPRGDLLRPRVLTRWPLASGRQLEGDSGLLAALPIDHTVPAVPLKGGSAAARHALTRFVSLRLSSYHEHHSHPDDGGTSRLSPYLHFGHISAHEVFAGVMRHERWTLGRLGTHASGAREGWWGVGAGAEAFLDQLVVWRELAFNTCAKQPGDYDRFESLPGWAQDTLAAHAGDPRPFRYDRAAFERAGTHDPLWNAAQAEMLRDGWMHNYMRMLWGKKILEWSASPREALETMIALMNRWALDGQDPNSYAGYMWTLGKYDRPWPERPIYGRVRSMSSANAARKVRVGTYLSGPGGRLFG